VSGSCRVFDVQRFSVHDGPGIRTTVFLAGCPLRCAWCQNPEAFDAGRAPVMTPREVLDEVLLDRAYYEASGGGLTISGGEPLLDPGLRPLLEEAKRAGLHTCVQTSGAAPQRKLTDVLGLVDLFQFDLKHMDPDRHRELTGASNARVHENARYLIQRRASVHFRMPLLPGLNDDPQHLDQVAGFLGAHGVDELRLVPYHRLYLDKYAALGLQARAKDLEPPSPDALQQVAARLARHHIGAVVDG
jgi:pyruvate formate lyase activating enzyme